MKNHNNNCDGDHCKCSREEVRVLPTGGDSNLILCRACFDYEIRYRVGRNYMLSRDCQFETPTWASLPVYGEAVNV